MTVWSTKKRRPKGTKFNVHDVRRTSGKGEGGKLRISADVP